MDLAEAPPSAADVGLETLVEIFRRTTLINRTDEKFRSLLIGGTLRLVYYPVRGQEVVAAAAMTALNADDYLVTTYRGVHDQLAKGIPSKLLWAEFTGKAAGACKGKGGPMHITHPQSGVMVTTGIVGAGLPIAGGLGLSSKLKGDGRVTLVSFGDGSTNIGAFHEALNMAQVWKLPVIFLCQNNRFGEHTPFAQSTSAASIVERARAYAMPAIQADGCDAEALYAAVRGAVDRARAGDGPTLVEAMTYRMLGHVFGSNYSYVPKALLDEAAERDAVPALRRRLLERQVAEATLAAIEAAVDAEIAEAVEHALASPYPDEGEIRRDVLGQEIAA
jgi:acetoin:2,6-dichlorophenolindophenol oxidoreductase subunit alpha